MLAPLPANGVVSGFRTRSSWFLDLGHRLREPPVGVRVELGQDFVRTCREPQVIGVDRECRHATTLAPAADVDRRDADLVRIECEPLEVPGRSDVEHVGVADRRIGDVLPRLVAATAHRNRRHEPGEPRPSAPARCRIVGDARRTIGGCDDVVDRDRHRSGPPPRHDDRRHRRVHHLDIAPIAVDHGLLGHRRRHDARAQHDEQAQHSDHDQREQPRWPVA
jgi:hypothetical protein